jgi:hypothetical protein
LNEYALLNAQNKLVAAGNGGFAADLYIRAAEILFNLPQPVQKRIINRAENMIVIYN